MKGADGEPLRVIETIAAGNYKMFGMYLLQDKNGTMVALLKKNHIHDGAESVTEAILEKWLTSDAPTRTYQHLIECLRQSELGALAELIANTTGIKDADSCIFGLVAIHVFGVNRTTSGAHKKSMLHPFLDGTEFRKRSRCRMVGTNLRRQLCSDAGLPR